MKCFLSGRSVLNRNLSEMRKFRSSWCFYYTCMLVWLVRKSHHQNLSYVGFKYSTRYVYVGWQLQITGADELLCTVNGRFDRPTDRLNNQSVDRSTFIFITGESCVLGVFEKAVLCLLITPFKGQRRHGVVLCLSPPGVESLELWDREF